MNEGVYDPAGQKEQLLALALENVPGPQALQSDAFEGENMPGGQGEQALLPLADRVPALQDTGNTDTAALQKLPGGQGIQFVEAEVE